MVRTDSLDVIQEEPACLGNSCDVLGEGHPVVHHHFEVPSTGEEDMVVSPSQMEKSEKGEVRAGMKISSVLPGLSFRWWLSIQLWMSLRQTEIRVETCVSDGGKERKRYHHAMSRNDGTKGPSVHREEEGTEGLSQIEHQ